MDDDARWMTTNGTMERKERYSLRLFSARRASRVASAMVGEGCECARLDVTHRHGQALLAGEGESGGAREGWCAWCATANR